MHDRSSAYSSTSKYGRLSINRSKHEEKDAHEMQHISKSSLRETMIGSACVALGQILFGTNDALVKYSQLKVDQLLLFRFVIQFTIAVVWWKVAKPSNCVNWYGDKPYIANIWIRGLCYGVCMMTVYYGYIRLPVGDATAIWHQAPILTAIIAYMFLNEKLPKTTPFIIVFAVVGTCFITQPTFLISLSKANSLKPLNTDGVVSIIAGLFTWSICVILVRTAKESHFIQLEIVSAGETTLFSVPILMTFNQFILHNPVVGDWNFDEWSFDVRSIIILVILGIFGFSALSLNVIGFQYGDATRVAWVEYTIILVSYLYQVFMFHDVPNRFELIGLVFVFLSCILNIFEEMYYHYKNDQDDVNHYVALNPHSDLYDSHNKGLHIKM